jgi:excisionase family DNA binding protein
MALVSTYFFLQGTTPMPPRKRREPQQTACIKSPSPQLKNGDILDVDEAAALLRVSKKTVYSRVKAGTFPYAKLGRKLLFSRAKLTQWVADGADLANRAEGGEQLTLDPLTGACSTRDKPASPRSVRDEAWR